MFEVRNIAFSYGKNPILRDISFVVSPGETISIIGANGTGKTTLLRILATLLSPEKGNVLLDGRNALIESMQYRRQLGFLPETPALCNDMTVKSYLTYRTLLKGEINKRIRRRVGEAMEVCKISDLAKIPILSLSAGQRKRVALADALALRPRVLLLDDFLSGLDYTMREITSDILSTAAAFSSVIITGHEWADLARRTTRFLVLRDGIISDEIPTAGATQQELNAKLLSATNGGTTE